MSLAGRRAVLGMGMGGQMGLGGGMHAGGQLVQDLEQSQHTQTYAHESFDALPRKCVVMLLQARPKYLPSATFRSTCRIWP
jgi:hypothetical protein